MSQQHQGRLIIVANRLPITVHKGPAGITYDPSSGGLATGLGSLGESWNLTWVGWPGVVPAEDRKDIETTLVGEHRYHPVFLGRALVEKFYEGFANRTIWPVFHSFPSYAKYSAAEWEAYKKANLAFARKVLEIVQPGDTIWIHDYHLLLLPRLLRDHLPKARIGFFLHIPFPHYEIFRLLPQHREILESIVALDLVGFHTHDYAQAFLGCVRRLMGQDNTLGQILVGDRVVQADVFPMGIDYAHYNAAISDPRLAEEVASIRKSLPGRKVVFSVSRLDYTKGIPESLDAIEVFFKQNPAWIERVVFVLVVVPSRERVERYAALKREIDEQVGRLNSTFATLEWQPIRYLYRSLSFGELAGLYASADVALVTPLRDGMNLIAKEFLATRADGRGVLVLSEMAGAAKELLEALVVNPNSREEVAAAVHGALAMSDDEQVRRNAVMRERLRSHDIHAWVKRFLHRLDEVVEASHALAVKIINSETREKILADYLQAGHRLIILDYDGTLVPFADTPEKAIPDGRLKTLLAGLASTPGNTVVLLSGRDRHTLERWLGDIPLTLVAEHGGWMRPAVGPPWVAMLQEGEDSWKKEIRQILQLFVSRIPGSLIEEKSFSLVWHYRQAESESSAAAARELMDTLSAFTSNLNIFVQQGNKTVEVRNAGIGKGIFYSRSLSSSPHDFTIALGDDWTDEDLFAVLPPTAYSVKVAPTASKARFNLRSHTEARLLIEELIAARAPDEKTRTLDGAFVQDTTSHEEDRR
jgi:trehalose 6-phosphate synthase/phosphatase